jgi:hypothetical protein
MSNLPGNEEDTKDGLFGRDHRGRSPHMSHQPLQRIIKTLGPTCSPGPPAIAGAQPAEAKVASGAV